MPGLGFYSWSLQPGRSFSAFAHMYQVCWCGLHPCCNAAPVERNWCFNSSRHVRAGLPYWHLSRPWNFVRRFSFCLGWNVYDVFSPSPLETLRLWSHVWFCSATSSHNDWNSCFCLWPNVHFVQLPRAIKIHVSRLHFLQFWETLCNHCVPLAQFDHHDLVRPIRTLSTFRSSPSEVFRWVCCRSWCCTTWNWNVSFTNFWLCLSS